MMMSSNSYDSPLAEQVCVRCGLVDEKSIEYHDGFRGLKIYCCETRCIIGKDVPARRHHGLAWHMGRVITFDPASSTHLMAFPDGTSEWVALDTKPMNNYLATFVGPRVKYGSSPKGHFGSSIHLQKHFLLSPRAEERSPSLHSKSKSNPLSLIGDSPRISLTPSFGQDESSLPLPSPLKHMFSSTASCGPSPSIKHIHEDTGVPTLATASPGMFQSPTTNSEVLALPLKSPKGTLYPKIIIHSEQDNNDKVIRKDFGTSSKVIPRLWSEEEDRKLLETVQTARQPVKWPAIANSIPYRTGKQCRERWLNHLKPGVKGGHEWTAEEDATLFFLYTNVYSKSWTKFCRFIPHRPDNSIKNRFHHLRRRILKDAKTSSGCIASRDISKSVHLERIRSSPTIYRRICDLMPIIQGILPFLAYLSVEGSCPTNHQYTFGPFRHILSMEQCRRCLLFAPSSQCGRKICNITGWCEACCRVPTYVSSDFLRDCLALRKLEV